MIPRVEPIELSEAMERVVSARIRAGKAAREERMRCTDPTDRDHFRTVSERNMAMVKGAYWSRRYPNDKGRRHRNHIGPALLVKHQGVTAGITEFELDATEERFVPFQEQAQGMINHLWTALSFDDQCADAHWDSGIHGFGVVEIGWEFERGSSEPSIDGRPAPPLKDDPFIERFDPRTLIVDPQCSTYVLKDARYVFREKREVLERVKHNPRYRNTAELHGDVGKWRPESPTSDDEEAGAPVEADFRLITLYDGYVFLDLEGDGRETMAHVVMTNESEKPLLCETVPFDFGCSPNPFPFEILPCWVVDNDRFLPEPDVSQAAQRQRANDEAVTQLDNKRASLMDILMAPDGIFQGESGAANREILEGRKNGVLKVPQGMAQFVHWLGTPSPNMEMYREVEMAAGDIKQIMGVSDYQLNSVPTGRDVLATEVLAMKEQGGVRQSAAIDVYSAFKCRIAYKVMALMQIFGNRSRQYRFTSTDGTTRWGRGKPIHSLMGISEIDPQPGEGGVDRPGLQWRVRVSASSLAQRSRFIDRQEKMKLLEIAGQFAGLKNNVGQPVVNITALLRAVFQTFDLPSMSEIIAPDVPTPPMPAPQGPVPGGPGGVPGPQAGPPVPGMAPQGPAVMGGQLPGAPMDPAQLMARLTAAEGGG